MRPILWFTSSLTLSFRKITRDFLESNDILWFVLKTFPTRQAIQSSKLNSKGDTLLRINWMLAIPLNFTAFLLEISVKGSHIQCFGLCVVSGVITISLTLSWFVTTLAIGNNKISVSRCAFQIQIILRFDNMFSSIYDKATATLRILCFGDPSNRMVIFAPSSFFRLLRPTVSIILMIMVCNVLVVTFKNWPIGKLNGKMLCVKKYWTDNALE